MKTAWERLEERFGKPENAIVSILENLSTLELKGRPYERIEMLSFEIAHSESLLENLGAKDRLSGEVQLVTTLTTLNSQRISNMNGGTTQLPGKKYYVVE